MLKQKAFMLHDKPVTVLQASWDVVMMRTELEEKFASVPDPDTGKETNKDVPEDILLAAFAQNLYPVFAACTLPMPTLEEAYAMANTIDDWYSVIKELNPSWFVDTPLTEETLSFGDGTTIIVKSQRPSIVMRRAQLEYEASLEQPNENMRRELFRAVYYPMLASCSFGDVPSSEESRTQMTADDIQLWYDAVKRQNPDWLTPFEEIATRNLESMKGDEKKSV